MLINKNKDKNKVLGVLIDLINKINAINFIYTINLKFYTKKIIEFEKFDKYYLANFEIVIPAVFIKNKLKNI